MNRIFRIDLACVICALAFPLAAFGADSASPIRFVAGTAPYQRPANAPVIKTFEQKPEWRMPALHGISEPVPTSLKFLDNQGAWYTPFTQAGMPGYYDLRQWHVTPATPAKPKS